MLEKLHKRSPLQLLMALAIGICFGFLLQRGGVTRYDVIMGQLLLADWTVFKVILTAIVTGMVGIFVLRIPGLARLPIWSGSVGSTVVGGLIFWIWICHSRLLSGHLGGCSRPGIIGCNIRRGAGNAVRRCRICRNLSETFTLRPEGRPIRKRYFAATHRNRCLALGGRSCDRRRDHPRCPGGSRSIRFLQGTFSRRRFIHKWRLLRLF